MLGDKCRRRHLLPNPHSLRNDADKSNDSWRSQTAHARDKGREMSERFAGAGEQAQIAPRIEIVFDRQQEHVCRTRAPKQLRAIGVSLPAHAAKQSAIGRAEPDEITTASMIGAEDQFLRNELGERLLDVAGAKPRTIPAHRDHFFVAEPGHRFDRVFEAGRKAATKLAMDVGIRRISVTCRYEKVNVDLRRKPGGERGQVQEWPGRHRERPPP